MKTLTNQKIKKIEILDKSLWYKAWGYVENNTLYVGRYDTIKKNNSLKSIFPLGGGLYTNNANKSKIIQKFISNLKLDVESISENIMKYIKENFINVSIVENENDVTIFFFLNNIDCHIYISENEMIYSNEKFEEKEFSSEKELIKFLENEI